MFIKKRHHFGMILLGGSLMVLSSCLSPPAVGTVVLPQVAPIYLSEGYLVVPQDSGYSLQTYQEPGMPPAVNTGLSEVLSRDSPIGVLFSLVDLSLASGMKPRRIIHWVDAIGAHAGHAFRLEDAGGNQLMQIYFPPDTNAKVFDAQWAWIKQRWTGSNFPGIVE